MSSGRCRDHKKYDKECDACRIRSREYRRLRVAGLRDGTWGRGWLTGEPLERTRDHVLRLLAHPDVRQWMVCAAAGVGRSSLADLLAGRMHRATGTTLEALSGVTLAMCLRQITNPNQTVSGVGTARRLQAMAVDEWGATEIGDLIGVHASLVRRHRHGYPGARVTWSSHEQYRELFEKVQAQADPRGGTPKARTNAEKCGWVGAERWPDGTMDDPDAQPLPPPPDDEDWVAVTQLIDDALRNPLPGKAADYDRPIQAEIARHAHRRLGWTMDRIAELLGKKSASTVEYMLSGRKDRPHTRGGR